jgi:hypothetical protein
MKIIKNQVRKVAKLQDQFRVTVNVKKDNGVQHDVTYIVRGSRAQAEGRRAMTLSNFTRGKTVEVAA